MSRKQGPVEKHLRRLKKKIQNPKHWTQLAFARDINGQPVNEHNARAVCWCLAGAQLVTTLRDAGIAGYALYELIGNATYMWHEEGQRRAIFNDNHTHGEVMELLDISIMNAQACGL